MNNRLLMWIDPETALAIRRARQEEGQNFHLLRKRFPINRRLLAKFVQQLDEEVMAATIRAIRFAWILGDSCRTISRMVGWDKRNVSYCVSDLVERQYERRRTEARRRRQARWAISRISRHIHWDNTTVRRAVADLDAAHAAAIQQSAREAYQSGQNLAGIAEQVGIAGKLIEPVIGDLNQVEIARLQTELETHPYRSLAQLAPLFPRWSCSTIRKKVRQLLPRVKAEQYCEPKTKRVYYHIVTLMRFLGSRSARIIQRKLRVAEVKARLVYHSSRRRPMLYYSVDDAIDKLV